jgi:hypothetical protein
MFCACVGVFSYVIVFLSSSLFYLPFRVLSPTRRVPRANAHIPHILTNTHTQTHTHTHTYTHTHTNTRTQTQTHTNTNTHTHTNTHTRTHTHTHTHANTHKHTHTNTRSAFGGPRTTFRCRHLCWDAYQRYFKKHQTKIALQLKMGGGGRQQNTCIWA